MSRVYLAGPIAGTSYEEATDWRWDAACRLEDHQIKSYSPMRFKEHLAKLPEMPHTHVHPLSTAKGVMRRDSNDVRRADLVLTNLVGAQRVSIGTMIELGMAYALNIPIVIAMEDEQQIHRHPMVEQAAGWVVPTLAEAIEIAIAILTEG